MDKIPAGELIPQVEPIPAIEPVSKEGPIPDTQILARNTVIPSPVLTPAKSVIRATLSKICFLLCCIVAWTAGYPCVHKLCVRDL